MYYMNTAVDRFLVVLSFLTPPLRWEIVTADVDILTLTWHMSSLDVEVVGVLIAQPLEM